MSDQRTMPALPDWQRRNYEQELEAALRRADFLRRELGKGAAPNCPDCGRRFDPNTPRQKGPLRVVNGNDAG